MHSKWINKTSSLFSVAFFSLSLLSPLSNLEAVSWGKTEEVSDFEGVQWNGVYFDMNDFQLHAMIPNYGGASLENSLVKIKGNLNKEGDYKIFTFFGINFTPPSTIQEFVKMVQDANPNYSAHPVSPENIGTKYVVDLIPDHQDNTVYWRFLSSEDRLIKMSAEDTNESCRLHFFDSLRLS